MPTRFLIIMGVAGCGKSDMGEHLAARLGWRFLEGDDLHPPGNIEKMAQGIPLADADRLPWLQAIAMRMAQWRDRGEPGVITCSALRRSYRAIIADGHPDVCFVYLRADHDLIARRFAERRGHFMPASLIASQFETLEEPYPEENALTLDGSQPMPRLVDMMARQFGDGAL